MLNFPIVFIQVQQFVNEFLERKKKSAAERFAMEAAARSLAAEQKALSERIPPAL